MLSLMSRVSGVTDLLGRLTGEPGQEPGEEAELTGTLFIRPSVSSLQRLGNYN